MSDYKSILVHYDAGKVAPVRLETAIEIANTFGSHIACLYARSALPEPSAGYEATQIIHEAQQRMRAFDLSADLIVMGAWGHSRLREFMLGGVTRTLFESMTVPVLMSH